MFQHASGNRRKTQACTHPSTLTQEQQQEKHSKLRFLEAGKEKRIFRLHTRLETEARCGHTHAKPKPAILGKGHPKFHQIGNHRRIINISDRSREDQYTNVGLSMSSSTKAAIHLGSNCTENLAVYKNTDIEEILNSFGITQKLVSEHSEKILM